MKATLEGTYAGSGGKQHIKIVGDLTTEGLGSSTVDLSGVEGKIKALEDVVLALQTQVQALQAQNLQASVKELASALETLKAEAAQPVAASEPVVEAVAVETPAPAPTTSSKKKSAV
jgi:hypothetical protein